MPVPPTTHIGSDGFLTHDPARNPLRLVSSISTELGDNGAE